MLRARRTQSNVLAPERATEADSVYTGLLEGISFQPIFIMGDHRSGTTLLYQLLDATRAFNVVRAYHLIKYDEILFNHVNQREERAKQQLSNLFHELGVTTRRLDVVEVTPDLPEEYGFHLDQDYRPKLSPGNSHRFVELCQKIQFVSDVGKPLLLKNPWDFTNLVYIRETFPEAKYIFIHRHSVHTINSQIRAARFLYGARSPYHALLDYAYDRLWERPVRLRLIRLLFSPRLGLGLRVVLRHVTQATNYFLDNVQLLTDKDYICVRFEDLCADPGTTVTSILDFVGIEGSPDVAYKSLIQARPTHLLDEVERSKGSIMERLHPYLVYCGYTHEDVV